MRAAQRLQAATDTWEPTSPELTEALAFNRKIWTILVSAATEPDNPLPQGIKSNVAQLATFIFQRTVAIQLEPAPEKLGVLVRINRDIATGLRAQPQAA